MLVQVIIYISENLAMCHTRKELDDTMYTQIMPVGLNIIFPMISVMKEMCWVHITYVLEVYGIHNTPDHLTSY
jgi:hypothetical protein